LPDATSLSIFLSAAFILAVTPGPGLFYVMTRSLKGGRMEGLSSALGTSVGGMFHVLAGALGVSVLLANSATAFTVIKYLGAAYLIYLGIKTLLSQESNFNEAEINTTGTRQAFYQGITVEALNPKTALFFLAFIPQFVNPNANLFWQFLLLGSLSVLLNTTADVIVASLAGPIGKRLKSSPSLRSKQRYLTGTLLAALGVYVALTNT